jgi:hypothetical protein
VPVVSANRRSVASRHLADVERFPLRVDHLMNHDLAVLSLFSLLIAVLLAMPVMLMPDDVQRCMLLRENKAVLSSEFREHGPPADPYWYVAASRMCKSTTLGTEVHDAVTLEAIPE